MPGAASRRTGAIAGDIPEIVTELQRRSARLLHLEAQIEIARRCPDEVADQRKVEEAITAKLAVTAPTCGRSS